MKKTNFALLLLLLVSHALFSINTGDPAPAFVNIDLSGKYVFSKNFFGKGWVILDFFATYCIPCKSQLLELEKINKQYSKNNLTILVVAMDAEGGKIVKPYFEANPVVFQVLLDFYNTTAKKYGVTEIPTTFLINAEGKIVLSEKGYSEETSQKLNGILSKAFKKNPK